MGGLGFWFYWFGGCLAIISKPTAGIGKRKFAIGAFFLAPFPALTVLRLVLRLHGFRTLTGSSAALKRALR